MLIYVTRLQNIGIKRNSKIVLRNYINSKTDMITDIVVIIDLICVGVYLPRLGDN